MAVDEYALYINRFRTGKSANRRGVKLTPRRRFKFKEKIKQPPSTNINRAFIQYVWTALMITLTGEFNSILEMAT